MSSTTWIHQYHPLPVGEPSHVIVARLNQEWESIKDEQPIWSNDPSLEAILSRVSSNPDRVLSDLIIACQQGYTLAGRVVLQALLPKVILMTSSNPFPPIEHLLSTLWIRISRYPLQNRPGSIAANLVLDARKDALAESKVKVALAPDVISTPTDLTAQSVINTARCLNLATAETLSIMEKVYVEGLPSAIVAARFKTTPEAIRRRCCDAIKHLRANRYLLADLASA